MSTASEILSSIPDQLLNAQVSDLHVGLIAKDMKKWETLTPFLGITEAEKEEIRADNRNYLEQKQSFLFRWKEKNGEKASYRMLIIAVCASDLNDLAVKIKRLILHVPNKLSTSTSVIDSYRSFLQDCYREVKHPSSSQWPFSILHSYIDLSLQDIPLSDLPPNEREEQVSHKTVDLGKIFTAGNKKANRKIVLVEGSAGSGKTTLSWHACQQWAEGKLFDQYQLLIHIPLNDPAIRSASSLADIIPHPSEDMRAAIAKAIAEEWGKGVCFLFDACDEAPPSLWRGFLHHFLRGTSGRSMLPQCTILITARPEVHLQVPNFQSLLTARVVIRGFEGTILDEFIKVCLPNDNQQILDAFQLNPELVTLCNIPINAVILVHLFKSLKDNLPTTRTGLFKPLVCNLLIRYVQHTSGDLISIKELNDLPPDVLPKFKAVCSLAFVSFQNKNRVVEESTLKSVNISNIEDTLGFLQTYQHFTSHGPKRQYTFLHFALQEFLAAVHMSYMSEDKQMETIERILQESPLSSVLPFYAGLTQLSNRYACDVLLRVNKQHLDHISIFTDLHKNPSIANDRRRKFVALLNCIYESQMPIRYQNILPPSFDSTVKKLVMGKKEKQTEPPFSMRDICLKFLRLSAVDCLSLGNFIRHKHFEGRWTIDINQCSITGIGFEALAKQIKLSAPCRSRVTLRCSENIISHSKLHYIKDILLSGKIIGFDIPPGSTQAIRYTIEGIYPSPKYGYDISLACQPPSNLYHILLLLTQCKNVTELNLSNFDLQSNHNNMIIILLTAAFKVSNLQRLQMNTCQIHDTELDHLAGAVSGMKCLLELYIYNNPFSSTSLSRFLHCLQSSYSSNLINLFVKKSQIAEEHKPIVRRINSMRPHDKQFNLSDMQADKMFPKAIKFIKKLEQMSPDLLHATRN